MQHWWHRADRPRHAHALLGRPAVAAATPPRTTCAPPATRRSATRRVPFLEAPPLAPGDVGRAYGLPTVSHERRRSFEHCAARDRPRRSHAGAARPAAHGHRRLERRHEPRRARTAAARACGSASSCTTCWRTFAPLCEARGDDARAPRYRDGGARGWPTCWSWPGTASGTGARYFDDGTPLGSAQNEECQHRLASRSRGRCSRARAAPRRAERAMDAVRTHLVAAQRAPAAPAHAAVRPRRAGPRLHHAATARACARTAASTRTRALWTVMALARLGQRRRGDRSCSTC